MLCLLIGITVHAHDFEVGGIYYNITSSTNKTVSVTYQGSSYSESIEYNGEITIPEIVTYNNVEYCVVAIGESAFYGCDGLTGIIIPNSITSIGFYAFFGCSGLASITLGNSVTSIGKSAFYSCDGLTSVTIPNSVTSIGYAAFAYCDSLTSVTSLNPIPPTCETFVFYSVNVSNVILIVPNGSVPLYQSADTWKDFGYITEGAFIGVEDAFVEEVEAVEVARYDINGRLLSSPIKGVNIVKMSDGSVKKVVVK